MPRTLVGLDIGSSGVRAAEFTPGRRRSTLRRHAAVPLPQGVVRAGAVVDSEALTEALRTLWAQGKFGTKNVRLAIANAGVLVRQMDLDWMAPDDFRQALRYQVQDYLPFAVDDANLDYHLLEELEVTEEGKAPRKVARILLVAAARDMVDAFVEASRAAGLRTTGVELLPFALVRARHFGGLAPERQAEAIVDIGADVVSVVVHAGGVPHYVRVIPGVGGDSITEAVRTRYDWTWEDAERTKVFVGLPGHAHLDESQLHGVSPRSDGLDHAAQQVVVAAAKALVEEIVSTLDFYRAGPVVDGVGPTAAVTRVLLTGAGARLGGLSDLLGGRLDVPVEELDALAGVRTPRRVRLPDDQRSAVAVPVGLCVGASR